ncbi:MAG: DNA primase [Deltaproteobacteria bacterium]|nr:DNA primase [Deltaproteobacteria bacterium]
MSGIPDDKIAEVRSRADIAQVVGRTVSLKKAGRSFKGLCPFHQEKTPSFHVVPDKQIFHCFGCGAGGDVFRFLMDIDGLSFPAAVRQLAEEVGVEIPFTSSAEDARARAQREEARRLTEANRKAAEAFAHWLWKTEAGEPGRAHLRERGILEETARTFGLGYAPMRNDLCARLSAAGVSEEDQRKAGLRVTGRHGDYERFQGRLMVPIRTTDGKTVAFGARVVEGDHPAKYLNSAESPVYHKSEVLFGMDLARGAIRRAGAAVLVEGYFDVIALHQEGVERAVASCGTALTPQHGRTIQRLGADLHLVFDGDAAGEQAVVRAHDVVAQTEGLLTRVVRLPAGDDPDAYVCREGAEAFESLCADAPPITEFLIDRVLGAVGATVEERVRAAKEIRPLLQRISDPLARSLYLGRVADRLGFDEGELRGHLGLGRPSSPRPSSGERRPQPPPGRFPDRDEPPHPAEAHGALPLAPANEQALCLQILERPLLAKALAGHLDDFAHPETRALVSAALDAVEEGLPTDAASLLAHLRDERLVASLRRHLTENASSASEKSDEEAQRWFQHTLRRLRLDALDRREAQLRRETHPDEDPIARARRLSSLKDQRRQLQAGNE